MTRQRNRARWRKLIEQQKNSGLSAREFSDQYELSYRQLLKWRLRFAPEPKRTTNNFIELSESPKLSLCSGNLQIEVEADLDFHCLSRVIGALCGAAST